MTDLSGDTQESETNFGKRLTALRSARRLTLAEVSRRSGLTVRRLVMLQWGSGDEVTAGELIAISTALHVPVGQLIRHDLSARAAVFGADIDATDSHCEVISHLRTLLRRGLRLLRGA